MDINFALGARIPYFLAGGDRVCYNKKYYQVYGSYSMMHNNKIAVVHNLMDYHCHVYSLMGTDGVKLEWIPRQDIIFLSRSDNDNNMLQACYGLMRKYSNLPVTHPEDVLDPNTQDIEPDTACLFVDMTYASVQNCVVLGKDTRIMDEENGKEMEQLYTIELENGLQFTGVKRSLLYINEARYFDCDKYRKENVMPDSK